MAETIGTAYIQIEPSFQGVNAKIDQEMGGAGESGGKSFGSGFAKVVGGAGAVVAGAVAAGTTAVAGFAAASVQAGSNFDSSMAQVAATMGTTVDQIGDLRDFAQEMGSTTAFSATEAADALNYMALAGYDADTSMKMLPNVLNLAAAGGIDLASASDMVTDAQTALGLSIEETSAMVDQMAKASSKSNTSVAQLGDAFLTIGANARNVAGGTTELSTVLGVLADNGIKGSEAGTHLRNIMLAMNPTTDKAAAAWEQLGVNAYDAEGQMRALPDIFQDLNKAMEGMTEQEKTEIFSAMFNKTDLAAIQALVGTTGERFDELADAIANADGAAEEMANTQLDNLQGDITLFQSALEGAQIAVSDQLTPTLREFVQFGSEGLSQLTQSFQEGGLSGAMATFGELLSQGLNMIIEKLPSMVEAGMKLVSALGQGIMDNLPTIVDAATQILLMLVQYIIEALPTLIEAAAQIILQLATGIAQALPTLIPTIIEVVLTIAEYLIENIDLLIDASIQLMIGLTEGLINALPILIEKVPEIIVKLVNAFVNAAPKLMVAGLEIIKKLGNALVTYFPQVLAKIPQLMENLKAAFIRLVGKLVDVGKEMVNGIKQGIADAWGALVSWFSEKVSSLVNGVKDLLKIGSPSKVFADDIGQWIPAGIAAGIQSGMGVLDSAIDNMTSDMLGEALSLSGNVMADVTGNVQQGSISDVFDILSEYLPVIASGENNKFVLEGDLSRLFRAMQRESERNTQLVGTT